MKSFNFRTVGWFTIAAGISAVIGTIALLAFFATGNGLIGLIGDFALAFTVLLMIPLFIAMGKITMTEHRILGRAIQILGVLGLLSKFTGLILLISGVLVYERSVLWENVGSGLFGIAILLFALPNRSNPDLSRGYVWFSILFGVVMILNFVGLFYADAFNEVLQGTKSLSEANPVIMILLITAAPIAIFGLPIWVLWSGRLFQKGKDTALDLQTAT
jgi:hypothetical protein